jgi:outer membrane PBP1 activator LpoA protein
MARDEAEVDGNNAASWIWKQQMQDALLLKECNSCMRHVEKKDANEWEQVRGQCGLDGDGPGPEGSMVQ